MCYVLAETNGILKDEKYVQLRGLNTVWYDLWDYLKVQGKLKATRSLRGQRC